MSEGPNARVWEFEGRRSGELWRSHLRANWELVLDPISEDFSADTMSAADLMKLWVGRIGSRGYRGGLVPIYWYVESQDSRVLESMPFQYEHYTGHAREDFLTFFTWPIDTKSKTRLNWLELPVLDKEWNVRQSHKGGFIQEATGWKPAILQPFVFLDSLTEAIDSE